MSAVLKIGKAPTRGEKLFLSRKRRGESMTAAAKRLKVTTTVYAGWERGESGAPDLKLGKLKPHELCALARRRADVTIDQVAKSLKLCRYTVAKMEQGITDCERLTEYWSA